MERSQDNIGTSGRLSDAITESLDQLRHVFANSMADDWSYADTMLDSGASDPNADKTGDEHMSMNADHVKPIKVHPLHVENEAPGINAVLALPPLEGKTLWVKLVGSFTIAQPIVVGSNTFLDMRRATIRLVDDTNTNMLQSRAAYGLGRDKRIFVRFGKMLYGRQDNGQGCDRHPVLMRNVDSFWLHAGSFKVRERGASEYASLAAKRAIFVQNCNDFDITNVRMEDTIFDGGYVQGPACQGHISSVDVIGSGGEQVSIDFSGRFTEFWEDEGDISDIAIAHEPMQEFSHTAVKLIGASRSTVRNVSVRDFSHEWLLRNQKGLSGSLHGHTD